MSIILSSIFYINIIILLWNNRFILDYSRVEANPPHPNNNVEEVAHEAVVVYCEPTQPNPGCNETDAVRSARPKGKECRHRMKKMYGKCV